MVSDNLALINEELANNSTIRQYKLKAEFRDDGKSLVIVGKVGSYHQKQIALHLARKWAAPHTFILTTEIVVE